MRSQSLAQFVQKKSGKRTEEAEMAGAKCYLLIEEPRRKGAFNIILK